MNLATSKGFIFHCGKLKAYEFISAILDFENEKVEYICKLGGKKVNLIMDECPMVYENAKAFKAQVALKNSEVKWSEVLRWTFSVPYSACCKCDSTGELSLWMIEDNQPMAVPAPKSSFLYNRPWDTTYVGKGDYIPTREIALMHCDLIKVDEEGVETREASPASKLKLSDEQLKAIEDVQKALDKAKEMGVQIIMDTGNCQAVAFSTKHIEKFEVDYDCCGKDGEPEYGDLVQKVKLDIYDANLADYPLYVTWKE